MWHKNNAGLWIPDPSVKSSEVGRRNIQNWAAIAQSITTALAVAVAIPGIWIGLNTLREQRDINRSQLAVNESQLAIDQITQQRFERRYVSRFSWWDTELPTGPYGEVVLTVENRSVVPIENITAFPLDAVSRNQIITIADLQPCTRAQVRIQPLKVTKERDGTTEVALWITRSVIFSDPVDTWRKTYSEPVERAEYPDPSNQPPQESQGSFFYTIKPQNGASGFSLRDTRQPATDCGDSA